MPKQIYPCFWFDGQAEEAAKFYCQLFVDAQILHQNELVTTFEIAGQKFMALNGGPRFIKNPSISFFLRLESSEEVGEFFTKLSDKGSILMPLDTYPWSEKYGWCQDKYGINWQIMTTKEPFKEKIIPALMFTQDLVGQAEKAMEHYVSIFKQSAIIDINRYHADGFEVAGMVNHGRFTINDQPFIAFDSAIEHDFKFNEAISFVIPCDTQEEINYYWEKLTTNGGRESMCGWLVDKFGVSWQVLPCQMDSLMTDHERANRIMNVVMTMRKLNLQVILDA